MVVAVLALGLGAASARPAARGGTELALVAVSGDNRLVAVDLDSLRLDARLRVPRGPHAVAARPGSRYALVTSPPAGRVTLVDAFARRVVKVLSGFGSPQDAVLAPNGRYAYVTDARRGIVAVVSVSERRIVRRVGVGPEPSALAVSPDGRQVWVARGPSGRGLTILDTLKPFYAHVAARVATERSPRSLAFACAGERVWVTYRGSGEVAAFDTFARRIVHVERAGTLLGDVAATVDGGHIWVTDTGANRARMLFGCVGRVLLTKRITGPRGVAIGPSRGRVVVAAHESGSIDVLEPGNRRSRSLRVGAGPDGVAVALVP